MSAQYSYQDVAEHNTKKDLFLVIHDKVYDCTKFVDEHPYVSASAIARPATAMRGFFLLVPPREETAARLHGSDMFPNLLTLCSV
jgi:hypothetical protein